MTPHRFSASHSLRVRLMAATALLIGATLGGVVWLWAQHAGALVRQARQDHAQALATALANAYMNELDDDNWAQIRLGIGLLMNADQGFVYAMFHHGREQQRIVVAVPGELEGRYLPDVTAVQVSERALQGGALVIQDTRLLRDVSFGGSVRARAGDAVIDVASEVRSASRNKVGTVRIGVSLRDADAAVAAAVRRALLLGLLALALGLAAAWWLSGRLTQPLHQLREDAARIADGDLHHLARVDRRDELGALAASFNHMTAALRQSFEGQVRLFASLRRFVPEKFLHIIAPEGLGDIRPGVATEKRVAILFSDIRGYTSVSETMTPMELFRFLNDYLGRMGEAIDREGGIIDKYIGDAIMALFDDAHTDAAVRGALGMRKALAAFNELRSAQGLHPVDMGVGVHVGEVVLGTVGFITRIDSTAIGDAVNLASRVEGLTKSYGCAILVTHAVVEGLRDPDAFALRLVARGVKVKGKEDGVDLYEIQGLRAELPAGPAASDAADGGPGAAHALDAAPPASVASGRTPTVPEPSP